MPIVDAQQLMENLDGDLELLRDAFEIFCEESRSLQSELRAAAQSNNVQELNQTAHRLNGMLSNFFADEACQTAIQLEEIQGSDVGATAAPLIEQLSGQIETVQSEIQQIMASRGS